MQARAILVAILVLLFWLAPRPNATQAARRDRPAASPQKPAIVPQAVSPAYSVSKPPAIAPK